MKHIFRTLIVAFILFSSSQTFAQIDSTFDDDWENESSFSNTKFGGAGGFTPYYLFLDMKELNFFLSRGNVKPFSTNELVMYGGEGYGYIMFLKNVRVGGLGASGNLASEYYDALSGIKREVSLEINFSGVTMGYVFPFSRRLDVALDIMLGGGNVDIVLTRSNKQNFVWHEIWSNYGDPTYSENNYTQKISGNFFTYRYSFNIEYALLDWFGLRCGLGYTAMVSPEWKLDNKYDLNNVPNNISGKGMTLNFGIFAGAFGN
ncbi:MAG: hypothetical protein KGZ58_10255 [Ignavibacteriales bacterium]|nr:hypothetical protein [Ignavibacteriales bacterium]